MVDGCELVKLKLRSLSSEPFEESDFIIMEIGLLEDVKVPLMLLSVSWRVVDMASNDRLT